MRDAIDCDVHITVPGMAALMPYLDEAWRDLITTRGIDGLELASYPPNAPMTRRPDWRTGAPPLQALQQAVFGELGSGIAICNCLYGAQALHSEDLAAALCSAVNRWIAAEWLDRDPRLRASIVVPMQNPHYAVAEIERWADDPRFVQVLLLGMGEMLLGRRYYWPVYQAATRHGLPIGIHAGSSFRHPPSALGWPSYYLEDYVSQSQGFAAVLNSLVAEGVFTKFPKLKVVLMESGVTWLPACMWRMDKTWRGVRAEVPWLARRPSEIIREHVRLTLQPFDAPPKPDQIETLLAGIGSNDMLLYSSDYPHWHYDGNDAIPSELPAGLLQRIMVDNPLDTYPRLRDPS